MRWHSGLAGTSYGKTGKPVDAAIAKLRDEWAH